MIYQTATSWLSQLEIPGSQPLPGRNSTLWEHLVGEEALVVDVAMGHITYVPDPNV